MSSPLDVYQLTLFAAPDSSEGVVLRYHAPSYGDTMRAVRWAESKPEGFEGLDGDYLTPLALLALCLDSVAGLTRNGKPLPWPALPDVAARVRLLEQLPTPWIRRANQALGEVGELAPEEERPTCDSSP